MKNFTEIEENFSYPNELNCVFDNRVKQFMLMHIINVLNIHPQNVPTLSDVELLNAFKRVFWEQPLPQEANSLLTLGDKFAIGATFLFDLPEYPTGYLQEIVDAVILINPIFEPGLILIMTEAFCHVSGLLSNDLPKWY